MDSDNFAFVLEELEGAYTQIAGEISDFVIGLETGQLPESSSSEYHWERLVKAAKKLAAARYLENETLAEVSLASARRDLLKRAVALADALREPGR